MSVRINGVLKNCPGAAGNPSKDELVAEAKRREAAGKTFNIRKFGKSNLSQLTKPQLCELLKEPEGKVEEKKPKKKSAEKVLTPQELEEESKRQEAELFARFGKQVEELKRQREAEEVKERKKREEAQRKEREEAEKGVFKKKSEGKYMLMLVGPSTFDTANDYILSVGTNVNLLVPAAPSNFVTGEYYLYARGTEERRSELKETAKRTGPEGKKEYFGNFRIVARPTPIETSSLPYRPEDKDSSIPLNVSVMARGKFGDTFVPSIIETFYALDMTNDDKSHDYVFDTDIKSLLKYIGAHASKMEEYIDYEVYKIEGAQAIWTDRFYAQKKDIFQYELKEGKFTVFYDKNTIRSKVPELRKKAVQGSKEAALGGPFAYLPSGTIDSLGGKLAPPKAGVFLISYLHWKFLGPDLKELGSLDVSEYVDSVSVFPSGDKFVAIGGAGLSIMNFSGKVLERIAGGRHGWNAIGYDKKIRWAIPMGSDTILYSHKKGEEAEDLTSYSLTTKRKTVVKELEGGGTFGLFRLSDTKYARFNFGSVTVGDLATFTEEKSTKLKESVYAYQVIQVAPWGTPALDGKARFFTFKSKFQVIDIAQDNTVTVRLLDTDFGRFTPQNLGAYACAAAVGPFMVAVTGIDSSLLFFVELESGKGRMIIPKTKDIREPGRGRQEGACAVAAANGTVFFKSSDYPNGLLSLDPRRIQEHKLPGFDTTYGIEDKYIVGKNLSHSWVQKIGYPSGEVKQEQSTSPITKIMVLEPFPAPSGEYIEAVNATVKLMDIPGDIQNIVANFLL